MNGSTVSIKNVSKHFGDFHALDDIDFTIRQGEFFTLLGPSGCGKTTLLRIIAGFEFPDDGAVLFDDENVTSLPPNKRHSNTVFQNYALFPHLNVFENVAFSLRLKGTDKKTIEEKVRKYLTLVDLESQMYKKPNQLSGGQRQRVAIARALINEPKVLLLDEPLSALDAKLRSSLLLELDKLHDEIGITFIFVTHDQSEALAVSDRIAVMNKGKVLQIGTPFEIYESPATQFVAQFIGETNLFESTVVKCEEYKVPGKADIEHMVTLNVPALGIQAQLKDDTQATKEEDKNILVTDYEHTDEGQKVAFTIRPEKIRITREEPNVNGRKDINVFKGIVEEPVYTGFQSKFYVKLEKTGTIVKVFKQHTNYLDDGPEIQWKDTVYISWSAEDGYIVEDINK
ncbi:MULTISPECIES: ABC transporter ATP-binding protein [Treponema]|uniref:Spermidine/putrescine transport system ATP-binding protein n=1 Tax=Treponema rectale TaxID=744512 RepID=A0A840S9Q7_9SPIR|nr:MULTISPECIES: ABC transporter ATP-binding protein [Treponema]MBB5219429.1 spermidine/putrescine transport system ATP-binding protein [Treponema rectale]MBE6353990.1 ABC transporter ATP-binding protein [Treponema sp.]MBO6177307.1 ABC transporter ATP-binding protein [Treponema sp.]